MRVRLRTLHVDGRRFRWRAEIGHVRGTRECHRTIRVRAWGAGKNGSALQVDLLSKSWPDSCATDGAYPTPEDVRAVIEHALGRGWAPEVRGGTFALREDGGFELPAFLVTDRLIDPAAADPTDRVVQASRP